MLSATVSLWEVSIDLNKNMIFFFYFLKKAYLPPPPPKSPNSSLAAITDLSKWGSSSGTFLWNQRGSLRPNLVVQNACLSRSGRRKFRRIKSIKKYKYVITFTTSILWIVLKTGLVKKFKS